MTPLNIPLYAHALSHSLSFSLPTYLFHPPLLKPRLKFPNNLQISAKPPIHSLHPNPTFPHPISLPHLWDLTRLAKIIQIAYGVCILEGFLHYPACQHLVFFFTERWSRERKWSWRQIGQSQTTSSSRTALYTPTQIWNFYCPTSLLHYHTLPEPLTFTCPIARQPPQHAALHSPAHPQPSSRGFGSLLFHLPVGCRCSSE